LGINGHPAADDLFAQTTSHGWGVGRNWFSKNVIPPCPLTAADELSTLRAKMKQLQGILRNR